MEAAQGNQGAALGVGERGGGRGGGHKGRRGESEGRLGFGGGWHLSPLLAGHLLA